MQEVQRFHCEKLNLKPVDQVLNKILSFLVANKKEKVTQHTRSIKEETLRI